MFRRTKVDTSGYTNLAAPSYNGKSANEYGKSLLNKAGALRAQVKDSQLNVRRADKLINNYHRSINNATSFLKTGMQTDLSSSQLKNAQKERITRMIKNSKIASANGKRPVMAWNKMKTSYGDALKEMEGAVKKIHDLLAEGDFEAASKNIANVNKKLNALKKRVGQAANNTVSAINNNTEEVATEVTQEVTAVNNASNNAAANGNGNGNKAAANGNGNGNNAAANGNGNGNGNGNKAAANGNGNGNGNGNKAAANGNGNKAAANGNGNKAAANGNGNKAAANAANKANANLQANLNNKLALAKANQNNNNANNNKAAANNTGLNEMVAAAANAQAANNKNAANKRRQQERC